MKIGGMGPIPEIRGKYRDVARRNVESGGSLQGADRVDFSASAKSFAAALKAAKEVPEVRTELVSALRTRVDSGEYKVDSAALAAKMMSRVTL